MYYRKPHYYDKFSCTAEQCPDTCCAGWQIVIDENSLEKYSNVSGDFGIRLLNSINWREGIFEQYEKRCSFLNEEGRCSIHDARPGFCRMFPLGRLYEDGTFSYFLQVNECPKENKTKVKVRRWLDTPELGKYEAFTTKWHYYLKEKQNAARESEDDAFRQQISMNILKLFYLLPYDGNTDFYTQFADRMELAADKH